MNIASLKRRGLNHFDSLALRVAFILLTTLMPGHSRAEEIYEPFNSVRPLGMGGAYVTTVNDETALFLNPAGLGKLRDPFITVADPEVDVSSRLTDVVRFNNVTDVLSAQGLLDALNAAKGKRFHTRFQLSPSIALPNFGVGALLKYQIDGEVEPTGTTFSLDYVNDWALALGYNFRLFSGIVKLGFNGKIINRIEAHQDLPATSTGLSLKNIASEGLGVGTDVGLIISAPVQLLPSIGAVLRDAGDTSFNVTDGFLLGTGESRPAKQKQKLDAGLSINPILGKRVRATLVAELHDVMTEDVLEKADIMRRFHAGLELNMADFFFLRAGMNQKFVTGGFEFASERFQLQGATYGEDIGTPNNPREDRRFVGKFAIRF